jgi:hypothetical protein
MPTLTLEEIMKIDKCRMIITINPDKKCTNVAAYRHKKYENHVICRECYQQLEEGIEDHFEPIPPVK